MAAERLYARLLYPPDSHQMYGLLTAELAKAAYTCPMDDDAIQTHCFQPEPPLCIRCVGSATRFLAYWPRSSCWVLSMWAWGLITPPDT